MNHGDARHGPSGWNNNRDPDYRRRVSLVSKSMEYLRALLDERRRSCKTNLYDSFSDGSAQEHLIAYDFDFDLDSMEVGA